MKSFVKNEIGISMLEILLVVALIAIVAGFSVPVYQSFQVQNDLDIAATTLAQTLRRAQISSQGMRDDTQWGVYVKSGDITLFQGASYTGRDVDYDEVYSVPTTIIPSSNWEVVFDKYTGNLAADSSLILTASNGRTKNIVINTKGMVEY